LSEQKRGNKKEREDEPHGIPPQEQPGQERKGHHGNRQLLRGAARNRWLCDLRVCNWFQFWDDSHHLSSRVTLQFFKAETKE
jgi:hypothetical protein